jgi:nucleoside-diphosphate-sugar epimerase
VIKGNLLSREDCASATRNATVVFHLAAARGEKSYPDAFMNSVVTTRNLLDACSNEKSLKRFVSVSSFSVYTNTQNPIRGLLDETCPTEKHPERRSGDAYCFAKVKQEEIVVEYSKKFKIPYVIIRPGHVYGPGNLPISGRVGVGTFGIFLHLGGPNTLPLTYVDNCADAIAQAGLKSGVDGEAFNVTDDDLPSSSTFLHLYKKNVARFKSLYVPHAVSYALCFLWEKASIWSEGQLPPAFNRKRWLAIWKKTNYSNQKLKTRVGWTPMVSTAEGLRRYFESCRDGVHNA